MAKLNGVQTLDMVNGEITKVAYDGAEYVLVSGSGKVGDLALCNRKHAFFTRGEFYEVTTISDDGAYVHAIDDEYDRFHMDVAKSAKVFRKVSESSPTLEQRVSALESEVSALKGEIITFEGAEYRKVDREAREGDVVIFRKNTSCCAENEKPYAVHPPTNSSNGKVTFYRESYGEFKVYYTGYGRTRETVDVYELVAEERAPKFVVGDYVKVVKSELGNEGKIVQITDDSDDLQMRKANGDVVDADYVGIPVGDTEVYGFTEDQLVEATDEEIAEASKPKLKAGDFVKFTEGTPSILAGKPYEVFEDDGLYFVDEDGDQRWHHFGHAHEIVDAETAKWAKLGRKLGEFRKGDVVRVVDTMSTVALKVGQITTVARDEVQEGSGLLVDTPNSGTRYAGVELIAPVESILA